VAASRASRRGKGENLGRVGLTGSLDRRSFYSRHGLGGLNSALRTSRTWAWTLGWRVKFCLEKFCLLVVDSRGGTIKLNFHLKLHITLDCNLDSGLCLELQVFCALASYKA
jgi:hypothetical protein